MKQNEQFLDGLISGMQDALRYCRYAAEERKSGRLMSAYLAQTLTTRELTMSPNTVFYKGYAHGFLHQIEAFLKATISNANDQTIQLLTKQSWEDVNQYFD